MTIALGAEGSVSNSDSRQWISFHVWWLCGAEGSHWNWVVEVGLEPRNMLGVLLLGTDEGLVRYESTSWIDAIAIDNLQCPSLPSFICIVFLKVAFLIDEALFEVLVRLRYNTRGAPFLCGAKQYRQQSVKAQQFSA